MDLADFLLARIAEDEAAANHAQWAMQGEWFTTADDKVDEFVRRNSPARVLAECEAKRAVIAELMRLHVRAGVAEVGPNDDPIFRMLAVPYADHESYREEWKP